MEKETEFLKAWQKQINLHIDIVSCLLAKCSSISKDYVKSKEDDQKEIFNIFHIISDLYYRENFHSDIISFFLNPKEKHGGGCVYLNTFIEMLNKKGKNNINWKYIDSNDYQDAIVTREEGTSDSRIDILIKSETAKKAIIIENKINNAADMRRQIPRYYYYVQNSYIVDAIVYLPLDIQKEPDRTGWSQEDENNVKPLFVKIPAYDKSGEINLVKDWLQPSILLANDLDVVSTLRQYSVLIKKLNNNIMDKIVLEKFYKELLQDDNFQTAQSIRNMMSELPAYLADRICDKYRNGNSYAPFSKVDRWSSNCCYFEKAPLKDNQTISIDIYCSESGYNLILFCRDNQLSEEDFDLLKQNANIFQKFQKTVNIGKYVTHFDFFDENGMCAFIDKILEELRNLYSQNK